MVKIKAKNLKEAKQKALDRYGISIKISSGRLEKKASGRAKLNTYRFEKKKNKGGKVEYVKPRKFGHQSHADQMREALPPGKRISKNGKVYYEYRSNHADWPPTKKYKKVKKSKKKKHKR